MTEAKYFIDIQKAYTDADGNAIIQGVASGTLEDKDGERVSLNVLEKFAEHINSYSLPLTNGHQRGGAIDDDLGELNFAEVLYNHPTKNVHSLFVKGELDMDNPNSQYLVKAVKKGKHFAFSINGVDPLVKSVYSEKLDRMISEFVDVVPREVTVTTKPSYTPSFLEVLTKSHELQKAQGYTDYPDSARANAQKVLDWKDKYGDELNGMTKVGWARARQLAEGRQVTRGDLGEIASFARHRKNAKVSDQYKSRPWKDAGYVAWLGWGGEPMINWAQKKLETMEKSVDKELAKSFEAGDYVQWQSSGGTAKGIIRDVIREGTYTPDNAEVELTATESDPVYVIELITEDGEPRGQEVGHKREALKTLNITKSIMSKKEELQKSVEQVETEQDNIEEQVATDAPEVESDSEATELQEAVKKQEDAPVSETEETQEVEQTESEAAEEDVSAEKSELEKSYDKRKDGTELEKESDMAMSKIMSMLEDLTSRLDAMEEKVSSEMSKSFEAVDNVLYSLHEDMEAMKDAPLRKKSLVKSSDFGERKEKKKTTREIAEMLS